MDYRKKDDRYIMLIMADQRKVQKELKTLRKTFIETKGPVKELARLIYLTTKELSSINEEIELIATQAFFPYHSMSMFDMLRLTKDDN